MVIWSADRRLLRLADTPSTTLSRRDRSLPVSEANTPYDVIPLERSVASPASSVKLYVDNRFILCSGYILV
jgi:hypothetical protein